MDRCYEEHYLTGSF